MKDHTDRHRTIMDRLNQIQATGDAISLCYYGRHLSTVRKVYLR